MKVTHAMLRVMERCPGVCPVILIRNLRQSIVSGDGGLAVLIAQVRKDDFVELYLFRLPDGRTRYALATSLTGFIVTILEPDRTIWTTRGQFMLGENGLEHLP